MEGEEVQVAARGVRAPLAVKFSLSAAGRGGLHSGGTGSRRLRLLDLGLALIGAYQLCGGEYVASERPL